MIEEGRILCIGDIHGCAEELSVLVDALELQSNDQLVFLGDYIDRGEASARSIERLLEIRKAFPRTVFLRGNHEEMLLDFLGFGGSRGEIFVRAGGAQTLASYGLNVRGERDLAKAALASIPEEHLRFLREDLVPWHTVGPWAFVHAGVRPGKALEEQVPADLYWIRDSFLSGEHGLDATVIYGHTPQRDVTFSAERRIIGMDTGCVYGGRLSALDLRGGILHQVGRGGTAAVSRPVASEIASTLDEVGSGPVRQAREALLGRAALHDSLAT